MDDRLEEIKAKHQGPIHFYQRVQPDDLTWLIEQVESLRNQVAQMSAEIESAHQALNELSVSGNQLLNERIVEILFDIWAKEFNAQMKIKHEYNISTCQFCKKEVADNWYIRHVKSGCRVGGK